MINFGPIHTVPESIRYWRIDNHCQLNWINLSLARNETNRKIYEWNPTVTLARTTAKECAKLGQILAQKANAAKGPVAFLLPTKGLKINISFRLPGVTLFLQAFPYWMLMVVCSVIEKQIEPCLTQSRFVLFRSRICFSRCADKPTKQRKMSVRVLRS